DEARAVSPLVPRSGGGGLTYQVLCEITAARGAWDEAAPLAAAAREEATVGELLALPLYVDPLEGRAAAAGGGAAQAARLLRCSAAGPRGRAARGGGGGSGVLRGGVPLPLEREQARRELASALAVFARLGSVREAARARSAHPV